MSCKICCSICWHTNAGAFKRSVPFVTAAHHSNSHVLGVKHISASSSDNNVIVAPSQESNLLWEPKLLNQRSH
jgi:hypothetical protein